MKKFYPVIHIHNISQTMHNALLAKKAGADGVFLVNHHGHPPEFLVKEVISSFQDDSFSVGINYLMRSSANVWALSSAAKLGCKMFWTDNAGTDENSYQEYGSKVRELQKQNNIEFFGGIHFKYQSKPNRTIGESLERAFDYIRFPTLSGSGTGIAANVSFIQEAALAWQSKQNKNTFTKGLAIASGVSVENVEEYLPYIDCFLVASSIIDESSPYECFDKNKIETLCMKINQYQT